MGRPPLIHREQILQTARNNADHARVPAFAGNENERRIGLRFAHGDCFFQDHLLDRLAFSVVRIEIEREVVRGLRATRGQEVDAETAASDASTGTQPCPGAQNSAQQWYPGMEPSLSGFSGKPMEKRTGIPSERASAMNAE